ncbi:hypothetical protein EYF80_013133 [Liparis tanakae]|uniref:Uncharacterized protein n=1 Tax=Liparis tanakae TaxID=230148 RepID=A0A4Z2IFY6_9TELE|nr:hypothetical protein EYF80_013133 [Liparis tanakae]
MRIGESDDNHQSPLAVKNNNNNYNNTTNWDKSEAKNFSSPSDHFSRWCDASFGGQIRASFPGFMSTTKRPLLKTSDSPPSSQLHQPGLLLKRRPQRHCCHSDPGIKTGLFPQLLQLGSEGILGYVVLEHLIIQSHPGPRARHIGR